MGATYKHNVWFLYIVVTGLKVGLVHPVVSRNGRTFQRIKTPGIPWLNLLIEHVMSKPGNHQHTKVTGGFPYLYQLQPGWSGANPKLFQHVPRGYQQLPMNQNWVLVNLNVPLNCDAVSVQMCHQYCFFSGILFYRYWILNQRHDEHLSRGESNGWNGQNDPISIIAIAHIL